MSIRQFAMAMTVLGLLTGSIECAADDLERLFVSPPDTAKPRVMWMWMGCNVTSAGITRDLEALRDAGFGGATMFSLSDVPTTWSADIAKSPTPDVITWTKPWWKLVRHAASEARRLGLDFGMGNCAGYGTSGGPWITPELAMQEICWSTMPVVGPARILKAVPRPQVDPRAIGPWPIYNSDLGREEYPDIPGRRTFYRDIVLLALPATGPIAKSQVLDLSGKTNAQGLLEWDAPPGQWVIYRFGHTTQGTMQFPAQWKANGLECDKMNPEAVTLHVNHIVGEAREYLGDLLGRGFTHYHFDSYEACTPSWTPKMRQEFLKRRGYDLLPFLPTFADRTIVGKEETARFKADFQRTIHDLHRDMYFAVASRLLREAGLNLSSEPYLGPWITTEVTPHVHRVLAEFWCDGGRYRSVETESTVSAARACGRNIIEAEAFTSQPEFSKWSEYPAQIKTAGDEAFCVGINRFTLHRFVHQPLDDRYRPGYAMGQWGTHFDRTQTWWEPFKATVKYWQRCQALLQWGKFVNGPNACEVTTPTKGLRLRSIHRAGDLADVYFIANLAPAAGGTANCSFAVSGKRPELWDPVCGTRRKLPQYDQRDGRTLIPLTFAPGQSWFVLFRKEDLTTKEIMNTKGQKNFPEFTPLQEIAGAWTVSFDPKWSGPEQPVVFENLMDWTKRPEPGVKHYSGTATYRRTFDHLPPAPRHSRLFLDLGVINYVACVKLNGQDLGVVWCAPWGVSLPEGLLKPAGNQLEISVTNTWANRLIGDEQMAADCHWYPPKAGWNVGDPLKDFPDWILSGTARPSGRSCFTTWNYFKEASPLMPSGLLGPVRVMAEIRNEATTYCDREDQEEQQPGPPAKR